MKSKTSRVFAWVSKPMLLRTMKWIVVLSLASSLVHPAMQRYNGLEQEKFALEEPIFVLVGLRVFDPIIAAALAILSGAITAAMVLVTLGARHKRNEDRTEVLHA
jgi:hypothetical protein